MAALTCPHCTVHFSNQQMVNTVTADADATWRVIHVKCTHCLRAVIWLEGGDDARMVRPFCANRPLPEDVPSEYKDAFNEANLTLTVSPAASAALSRRLLQRTIHEQAKVSDRNLAREIQAVVDSEVLPTDLAEDLDAVRTTGNFAAHPVKSESTGEIVEVEDGEAEWLLDVLEELFDFYFVRPAKRRAKRDALNAKLSDVGKPQLKTIDP
jgi:hypothetical protein